MEKMFEDVSIFQGVREFNTPIGMMRFVMEKNSPVHAFVLEGKSYIHKLTFRRKPGQITNQRLYNEFASQPETVE